MLHNLSYGSNTLKVYVNDSVGNENLSTVTFFINQRWFFNFSKFTGAATTNLTNLSFHESELSNINNFTLANSYGKIKFNQNITLENNYDFDSHINISNGEIFLNSTALAELNIPATLTVQNLSYTNPRILKDGEVCSSSTCTNIVYTNGILTFTVIGFSTYTIEETPTSNSGSSGSSSSSSGGGGSDSSAIKKATTINESKKTEDFRIEPKQIKLSLKKGETKTETISIKNLQKEEISIELDFEELKDLIILPTGATKETYTLKAKEELNLQLIFLTDKEPDLYTKALKIKSKDTQKEIPIILEIESEQPLFDVKTTLIKNYINILKERELLAEINLFNLGSTEGRFDVLVSYEIRNLKGETLSKEQETLTIETQTSFVKSLNIPETTEPGEYILYVHARSQDTVGSSSTTFTINEGEKTIRQRLLDWKYTLFAFVIGIILTLAARKLWTINKNRKKKEKRRKKILEPQEPSEKKTILSSQQEWSMEEPIEKPKKEDFLPKKK